MKRILYDKKTSSLSLHLDEYTEITGFDPVAEHCRHEYFEHLEMQSAMQEEGLIDFVDTDFEKFYSQGPCNAPFMEYYL